MKPFRLYQNIYKTILRISIQIFQLDIDNLIRRFETITLIPFTIIIVCLNYILYSYVRNIFFSKKKVINKMWERERQNNHEIREYEPLRTYSML